MNDAADYEDATRGLARGMKGKPNPAVKARWGVVAATHANPTSGTQPWATVDVTVAGTTWPGVRYGGWYTPSVSDNVLVLLIPNEQGGDEPFVMGRPA